MYSVEDTYWKDPFPGTLADAPGRNFCFLFSDNFGGIYIMKIYLMINLMILI